MLDPQKLKIDQINLKTNWSFDLYIIATSV